MTDPQPVQPIASPNSNKTIGSAGGGISGAVIGTGLVALIGLKYPNLPPTEAAGIAGFAAALLGSIGTFLAPLLTAAQHRAIKALDGSASPDQKEIIAIGRAEQIIAASNSNPAKL